MDNNEKIKVIAVVGPTASGKTSLGIELAKEFGGEIISADSMQIYKGMNIATAKPDEKERDGIKHYLMDFLSPESEYSVAAFCSDAKNAVKEIVKKGKVPIIVGGTGLYVDSFIQNISFFDKTDKSEVREKLSCRLENEGIDVLYEELSKVDPEAAKKIHKNNTVKVLRALEVFYGEGKTISEQVELSHKSPSPYDALYVGISCKDRENLYSKINRRVDIMLENGLLKEAEEFYLRELSATSVNAIGYKELKPFIDDEKSLFECVEHLKQSTRRYAKRQLTWFKRNKDTKWFYSDEYDLKEDMYKEIKALVNEFLGR